MAIVALALLLSACAGFVPNTGEKSLTLVQPQTREQVHQTWWRNGGHDQEAIIALSRIFRDPVTGDIYPVDPALLDYLHALRTKLGLPASQPIEVVNGYRDPARNRAMAKNNSLVAKESLHMHGKAVDIRIPGIEPQRILDAALALKKGGAALYPGTGHVHLDTGPARTWVVHQ
ncbi:MAG: DUF882 domain-containing protein [Pseudomonadota bacterium]|nr:DUF882 domain-containing protein [Pseudomonadota bacterium]